MHPWLHKVHYTTAICDNHLNTNCYTKNNDINYIMLPRKLTKLFIVRGKQGIYNVGVAETKKVGCKFFFSVLVILSVQQMVMLYTKLKIILNTIVRRAHRI